MLGGALLSVEVTSKCAVETAGYFFQVITLRVGIGKMQVGSHTGNLQNTLIKAGFFTLDSNWFMSKNHQLPKVHVAV